MLTCPACGRECPPDFAFCPGCGAQLAAQDSGLASGTAATPLAEERKVVTTLFCDLVRFTAHSEASDHELIDGLLQQYNALARRLVDEHGGAVEKFIGDAVLAVFGFPLAHEDDAERAVRCALRLVGETGALTWPDGDPVAVRIGVNSGETFLHTSVDPASGETFLTGDAVNTAARLETAAPPGGVVVGEPTQELTAHAIAYEELEPLRVKGKKEAVRGWLAKAAGESRTRTGLRTTGKLDTPFLGREPELRALEEAFDAASSTNQAESRLLVGELGIGKSRLVLEFARVLDERPDLVTWRQGRCLAFGDGSGFAALSEIVEAHAGILDSDDVATVEAKLEAVLPEGDLRPWLRQRLRPLLGLEAAPASQEESFAAWTRFLQHIAATGPAVLVLEDLHWAGEGMLAFVEHLATQELEAPLLVLATTRPELLTKHSDALAPGSGIDRIILSPLTRRNASRLVSALLDERVAATVRAPIVERVGGNPLYAEEYVRLLLDRGLLLKTKGVLQLREGADLPLPDTVQAVLAARLDTLPSDHKALLCDAAVFGESFWDGGVAAVAERAAGDVERVMTLLTERQLVRHAVSSTLEGESEYIFWHALTRDVAYGQLPRKARAHKHADAGAWFEAKLGERTEDFAEVLAHHWATALDLALGAGLADLARRAKPAAVRNLRAAGDRVSLLDRAVAERHYNRALTYVTETDLDHASLLGARGRLLKQLGRYDEAAAALEQATEALLAQGSIAEAAFIKTELAGTRSRQGDADHLTLVEEAVALLDGQPHSAQAAEVLDSAARFFYGGGRLAAIDALSLSTRAVDAARAVQSPSLCSMLAMRGILEGDVGDVDASEEDLREAIALTRDLGLGFESFIYSDRLYQLSVTKGPKQAYEVACDATQLFRQQSDVDSECFCRASRVELLTQLGNWDRCLQEADELSALLERSPRADTLAGLRGVQVLVATLQGRPEHALSHLEWLECSQARDDIYSFALVLVPATSARLGLGEPAAARALLRGWDACADRAPGDMSYLWLLPQLARAAAFLGQVDVLARIDRVDDLASPMRQHAQLTVRAIAGEAQGDPEAAVGFANAAARWHGFDVPYEEAQALLGQGRCLVALGQAPEAAPVLGAAREIFARLGAKPALAEAEALLGEVSVA